MHVRACMYGMYVVHAMVVCSHVMCVCIVTRYLHGCEYYMHVMCVLYVIHVCDARMYACVMHVCNAGVHARAL